MVGNPISINSAKTLGSEIGGDELRQRFVGTFAADVVYVALKSVRNDLVRVYVADEPERGAGCRANDLFVAELRAIAVRIALK